MLTTDIDNSSKVFVYITGMIQKIEPVLFEQSDGMSEGRIQYHAHTGMNIFPMQVMYYIAFNSLDTASGNYFQAAGIPSIHSVFYTRGTVYV